MRALKWIIGAVLVFVALRFAMPPIANFVAGFVGGALLAGEIRLAWDKARS